MSRGTFLSARHIGLLGRQALDACRVGLSCNLALTPSGVQLIQVSALVLLDPPDLMPSDNARVGGVASDGSEANVQPAVIAAKHARRLRAIVERFLNKAQLEAVDLPFQGLVLTRNSNFACQTGVHFVSTCRCTCKCRCTCACRCTCTCTCKCTCHGHVRVHIVYTYRRIDVVWPHPSHIHMRGPGARSSRLVAIDRWSRAASRRRAGATRSRGAVARCRRDH